MLVQINSSSSFTQASLHVLTLKKLNRLDKMRLKASRNLTNEAKLNVDALHLQLQNLLYEVMHLQKEINKCQQFKSKDEEIDLIPVEVGSPASLEKL